MVLHLILFDVEEASTMAKASAFFLFLTDESSKGLSFEGP